MEEERFDAIASLLAQQPGLTARDLAAAITLDDPTVTRGDVNRVLYAHPGRFRADQDTPPRWELVGASDPHVRTTEERSVPSAAPGCPECQAPMLRRVSKRGPQTGTEFWGCSRYPSCKGTRKLSDATQVGATQGQAEAADQPLARQAPAPETAAPGNTPALRAGHRRVQWTDSTTQRLGWIVRYSTAGGTLRSVPLPVEVTKRVSGCWIAREDTTAEGPGHDVRRVVATLRKILQRGDCPPIHPDAERALLDAIGVDVQDSELPGDLTPRLRRPLRIDAAVAVADLATDERILEEDFTYDSDEERRFHHEVVPDLLGPGAARWFLPQAPLDGLLRGAGREATGARRVDFLVVAPWLPPFVVEIDGAQHDTAELVDDDRDAVLVDAGYDVLRIPTAEITRGGGPQLDALARRWHTVERRCADLDLLVWTPTQLHRFALGVLEGLEAGFLGGEDWTIRLHDPTGLVPPLARPYLDLLAAIDTLWGGSVAPRRISLVTDGETITLERHGAGYGEVPACPGPIDLELYLDIDRTPTEQLPEPGGPAPRVVVRSADLPVLISDPLHEAGGRADVRASGETLADALRVVLRAVFAKADFRGGQLAALTEVLEGRDCAVLLPTGAGKSLIYQLAGLCLPGRTLVIDPIVALIEDQLEGLRAQGIDRALGITRDLVQASLGDELHDAVGSGEAFFVLVAPERLQMQRFREELHRLAAKTPINLAVVDEAHCVSEWGHDFRTSYLNLGRVLRRHCADPTGPAPPILALTGTASRAVLRDVLLELGIETRTEHSIVRPKTFDRPELSYLIHRTQPALAEGALQGVVGRLPGEFSVPTSVFFQPRAATTASGLVFCPTVNGRRGVGETAKAVTRAAGHEPLLFSGKAPKGMDARAWSGVKRDNARRFKSNQAPILVTTKAFGMGIDKPNIRWVVHYGIPGSIEAYYQEVGRAGRDGKRSVCALVLIEYDEARNRGLLADDLDLAEGQRQADGVPWSEKDDVTTALFFHYRSFPGVDEELDGLLEMAELLEPGDAVHSVTVPFGGEDDRGTRERALHRLVLLGVVDDYLVDWGGRQFDVRVRAATPAKISRNLLGFVERSQPGRVGVVAQRLETRTLNKVSEAIEMCGRELIEFVYDTIERSRRRSLREMWLAARESQSDAQLRQRVLDYLSEGDIAPVLEGLVDEDHFEFEAWRIEYERILTIQDAREWRGNTARLLASYPDHPGLLLGRACSEMLDLDSDLSEFGTNLASSLISARNRYGIDDAVIDAMATWVLRTSEKRRPDALAVCFEVLGRLGLAADEIVAVEARALAQPDPDPGVAVVALTRRMEAVAAAVADLAEHYQETIR